MLKFVQADACETLRRSSGMADLVFMDPPFNIGVDYANCNDKIPDSEFLFQLQNWIDCSINAIKIHGSIWLHLPDRWAPDALVYARKQGLKLENWIIWHFRFGVCQPNRFINSKCHGLWFSLGNPKVNVEAGYVASDRASLYNDWRSDGTRMDLDVWGFEKFWGRVQGNNKERRPLHPNQLPEKYLERIIKLTTIAGDLVIDPFCGSGTTAAVADALGRHCITGDLSQEYLDSAKQRTAVRVSDKTSAQNFIAQCDYSQLEARIVSNFLGQEIVSTPEDRDFYSRLSLKYNVHREKVKQNLFSAMYGSNGPQAETRNCLRAMENMIRLSLGIEPMSADEKGVME